MGKKALAVFAVVVCSLIVIILVAPDLLPGPAPTTVPPPVFYGSRIAFASECDGNWEIYTMNADGNEVTRLTDAPGDDTVPLWSPDGQRIAFTSDRDGNWEIYAMYADGSGQTNLTGHPTHDTNPIWSPDGTRIAFLSERDAKQKDYQELYVMNADGSGQTRLMDDSTRVPCWSPDGTHIVFVSGTYYVYYIHLLNVEEALRGGGANSSVAIRLADPSKQATDPSWSPDGTHIAFLSVRYGNPEICVLDVQKALQNPEGYSIVRLTNNLALDAYPSWSPDGSRIAFISDRNDNMEIYVMNTDGSDVTNLTNDPGEDDWISWSPDSSRIAFMSDRDGNWDVYVVNVDGSGLTRLTDSPADDRWPAWSPE